MYILSNFSSTTSGVGGVGGELESSASISASRRHLAKNPFGSVSWSSSSIHLSTKWSMILFTWSTEAPMGCRKVRSMSISSSVLLLEVSLAACARKKESLACPSSCPSRVSSSSSSSSTPGSPHMTISVCVARSRRAKGARNAGGANAAASAASAASAAASLTENFKTSNFPSGCVE